MNQSSGETPNLNLPQPVAEQPVLPTATPEGQPETAPKPVSSPERASAPPAATPAPLPAMPSTPAAATQVQQTTDDVTPTSKLSASKLIKDDDLIEKEWVDKAKRIVEQTRDDPHRQSEQLTIVRADYVKQHYNKTIKVNK